ncbi:MAG: hypothetical protein GX427_00260 [Actinomycetales bacterium]|jgi:hypothetical protein|nr:hypothetical protein [Actinomycetales bacterium]
MSTQPTAGPVITSFPAAPIPTPLTLAMRKNLLVQAVRFVAIDARIMMMVIKGHEE